MSFGAAIPLGAGEQSGRNTNMNWKQYIIYDICLCDGKALDRGLMTSSKVPEKTVSAEIPDELAVARAMIHARETAGLTQEEVAGRMKTSQSAVARLESGRAFPSLNTLKKYAKATNHRLSITFAPERSVR
jgi:DNA-binding XRE family transcriptional regulator